MGFQLIYYYSIGIILLALSYIVGFFIHLLIFTKSERKFSLFVLFTNLIIGLVFIVSIYSIAITSGRTISWIYLLLLFSYGYFLKQNPPVEDSPIITKKGYLKLGLNLFFVSLFFFIIYLSSLLDFSTLRFTDTFCDWEYYSKTSQYLNLGFESTSQFDNIAFESTFTPYHYFEIWIVAFISKIFVIPSQIATSIIMPYFLGCIAYVGVLSFSKSFTFKSSILTLLLLFISSVSFFSSFLKRIGISLSIIAGDTSAVVSSFKLYSFLIFFVLSLHYILQKKYLLSFVCLLFIPVASFVAAPCILPFVWIVFIYLFFLNRRNSTNNSFLLFLTIYSFLFVIYYLYFWDKLSSATFIPYQSAWTRILSVVNPVLIIINTLPFLFFVLYFRKDVLIEAELKKYILISYSLILLLSILIVALTSGFFDGIQFFINEFTPLSTALIALFVLRLNIPKKRFPYKVLYSVFIILVLSSMFYSLKFMCWQSHTEKQDQVFIRKINDAIAVDKSKIIYCGFIHSKAYYSGNYLRAISKVTRVGEALDSYRNNFLQVGLSDFVAKDWLQNEYEGDEKSKESILSRIPEGTFYKYVEFQKKEGRFVSIEQSQMEFIKQFKITYIFIQNDAEIQPLLLNKIRMIVSEEKKAGYSFYKIIK